ncbi:LOW QUALITY PROTEIN: hypothetical protein V1478_015619 [Vespula squamosa]|uniref:Uncharacterized protein n=1 Tax=Vespula squamosa TaxID=30214 RepID=A0ABD2A1C3_VESSQ
MCRFKVRLLYVHFKLDYEVLSDEEELNIMKKYTNRSKLYVYLIVVLIILYVISITFPSIINVFLYIFGTSDDINLTLPFPVNNVLNAGLVYYSLLIYQVTALFIVGIIGSACYSLYWVLIQHVCGQFSIIMWKIRRPFKNDKNHIENDWCDTTPQEEWDWMIDIIKCYTRITELLFQLSLVLQSASETIKCCIYMAGSISTIYISYYVGQLLIDHSNDAFMELCQIPFYTLSIKTQKLLLLLLIRSMKPSEISIGGIFVASHEIFAGLIQKAFSFATVYYINVRYSTMSPIGLSYYERHFLFSNRLVQFFLGLNSRDQFFMFCAILLYLLPMIVHQFYQLYTADQRLQPAIEIFEKMIPGLHIIYCYIKMYLSLTTIKLLIAHIKFDYEFLRNEKELNIMEKYTEKILLYLYLISITSPSILSVFLYIFGTSGSVHLTLPSSVDSISQAGSLYFSLLIYQIIAIYIIITMGIIIYSFNWVLIQHACGQLRVIIWNIRKAFNNDQKHVAIVWSITTPQEEINWMIYLIKFYTRITNFYIGELLIQHSNDVFEELCTIPFYNFSIRTQKLLLLLLIRSMKPIELSIGVNVRYSTMLPLGLSYYERHFLFSNRLVQFLLGLNSRDQFFMLCAIVLYLLPMIVHQFYQLYTTEKQLQPAIKVFESMHIYLQQRVLIFQIKLLIAHIKFDYEFVRNEMELNIMEKYTEKSKLYVYFLVVLLYLYLISITFPSILSVFLYIFGTSGSVHLTLPFSVDSVLQAGWNIRKAFNNDQKHVAIVWSITTPQEEINWMIYLIKFYTRITNFYIGQLLIQHSNDVFEELCNIPFYNFSIRTQKLLLLLLIRSMKPTELSIGVNVRYFTMLPIGLSYYERHFIFSNPLVQCVLGFRPNHSSVEALLLYFAIIAYLLPLSVHQCYQVCMTLKEQKFSLNILESIIPGSFIVYFYTNIYFNLAQIKLLCSHVRLDYELIMDEKELNIMEKYTNQSKLYIYLLIVLFYLHFISKTAPSILNVFLYIFGSLDGIDLTLPFPIHNVLQTGLLYYCLLIYQIISAFLVITIGIICYSMYWTLLHHAYAQFNIIVKKVHQPFRCDQRYTQNAWYSKTSQEELDWIIDIIKCHGRVTELIFQLFSEMLDTREAIEGFIYMVALLFTVYFNFYLGQLLINHSNAVFRELCNIPFYILSIKTQKLLLFLLTRSIKPCKISVIGVFVISHKVFAEVIFFLPVKMFISDDTKSIFFSNGVLHTPLFNRWEKSPVFIFYSILDITMFDIKIFERGVIFKHNYGTFFVLIFDKALKLLRQLNCTKKKKGRIYLLIFSVNVRYSTMSPIGLSYYERHFLFSNRLVQYVLGFRPNHSSVKDLLVCYAVIAYLLPLSVHQFYQLYTMDGNLKSAIKIFESMLPFLYNLYCYSIAYFNLTTVCIVVLALIYVALKHIYINRLFSHVRLDHELVMNKEELNIMENILNIFLYISGTSGRILLTLLFPIHNVLQTGLLYYNLLIYQIIAILIIITMSIIIANIYLPIFILNVFLYIFGSLDGIDLTLPFPIHNVLQIGLLYYCLLIYQIISAFLVITIGIICYSMYWTLLHHVYAQFNIIVYVFNSDRIFVFIYIQ